MKAVFFSLGLFTLSLSTTSAYAMEEKWIHIKELGEQALMCVVEEAHIYEFSREDEKKGLEQFSEDYALHIDARCQSSYDTLWAAIEDSSMPEDFAETYKDTLESAYNIIVSANAQRYWEYYNPEKEQPSQ